MLRRMIFVESDPIDPEAKGRRFRIGDKEVSIDELEVLARSYKEKAEEIERLQENISVKRYLDAIQEFRSTAEKLRNFGYGEIIDELDKNYDRTVEGIKEANEKLKNIALKLQGRAKSLEVVINNIKFGKRKQLNDKQIEKLKQKIAEYFQLSAEQYEKLNQIIEEILAENTVVSASMEIVINVMKNAKKTVEDLRVEVELPQRKLKESVDYYAFKMYLREGRPSWLDKIVNNAVKVLGDKALRFVKTIILFFEELFNSVGKLIQRTRDLVRNLVSAESTIEKYEKVLVKLEDEINAAYEI